MKRLSIYSLDDPIYARWVSKQSHLTQAMADAFETYTKFHQDGYPKWRRRYLAMLRRKDGTK